MKTLLTQTKKQHIIAYVLLFALTVLAVRNASAQREGANWYFGNYSGLNLAETPLVVNDGVLASTGASTSYSTPSGELAVYSDGQTIWNGKHLVVTDGNNIKGNKNTSQGALLVRMPGLDHFVFCFTTGLGGQDSLRFTLVDIVAFAHMCQVDPMTKNTAFYGPVEEKLTAVNDGAGNTWVMAHGYGNNKYIAYKLSGIQYPDQITPVISEIGNTNILGGKGCMKFSPDGKKIARTIPELNKVEIGDFNLATGEVTNIYTILNMTGCYGLEFSSNSKRLYVTTEGTNKNYIHQFDLKAGSFSDIMSSKYSLIPPDGIYPTGLQLGYDGVLYAANSQSTTLGIVSNADTLGAELIYGPTGIDLGRPVKDGLPAFNQSYFNRLPITPPPVVTAVNENEAPTVAVYPNPSNGTFKLNLGNIKSETVKLNVFNMTGATVYSNNEFEKGQQTLSVDLTKQPAGIYFFEVTTNTDKFIRRLVIN